MHSLQSSIRNKLLLLSGAGTALVLAATLFGFWLSWGSIQKFSTEVAATNAKALQVRVIQLDFKTQVQEWKNTLLRGSDPAALEKYWGSFQKHEQKVQESAQALRKELGGDPKSQELVAQFISAHQEMGQAYRKGFEAFKESNFDSKVGDKAVKGIDRAPTEFLTQASENILKNAEQTAKQAAESARNGMITSLALIGVAVLVAFIIFLWMLQQAIVKPAAQVVADLGRLAQGDFAVPVHSGTQDELGRIAASAEQIRVSLGNIIADVNRSAADVSGTATILSETTERVTSGSQKQADAAAATAAGVEEMAVSIASVAENAQEVRSLSTINRQHTQNANTILSELVGNITAVENAVQDIARTVREFVNSAGSITHMTRQVKDIAEQTNLLALNAAIEAARAGEQGRGFAVVADEVRKLAEKSAQTADEINAVTQALDQQSANAEKSIEHGMNSLQTSSDALEHVATALSEANASVLAADQGVGGITSSVEEQRAASDDIARNVERIAQMTEENRRAIDETANTAQHLRELSTSLRAVTDKFKM